MSKGNGKDEDKAQPQQDQVRVPVLAQIVHNPETNEMGLILAPAVTDHVLFGTGLLELTSDLIRKAHLAAKAQQSPIARINPGGVLRP